MVTCSDGGPHHWVIADHEDHGEYPAVCQKCGTPRKYPGLEYQLDENFSRLQTGVPVHRQRRGRKVNQMVNKLVNKKGRKVRDPRPGGHAPAPRPRYAS